MDWNIWEVQKANLNICLGEQVESYWNYMHIVVFTGFQIVGVDHSSELITWIEILYCSTVVLFEKERKKLKLKSNLCF